MIVHLCPKADWIAAQDQGQYWTAANAAEGFIHCSRPDQILRVANLYFPGQSDLLLLWIDLQVLIAELLWEPVEADHYPHLYGPLNLDAVRVVTAFPPDADGVFRTVPEPD